MKEDTRLAKFQVAYHHEPTTGFVLSNGSVGTSHHGVDMSKYQQNKRAVSSKKVRVNKKKTKVSSTNMVRVDPNYGGGQQQQQVGPMGQQARASAVYQKLPTGGPVQSYTTNNVLSPHHYKEVAAYPSAQQQHPPRDLRLSQASAQMQLPQQHQSINQAKTINHTHQNDSQRSDLNPQLQAYQQALLKSSASSGNHNRSHLQTQTRKAHDSQAIPGINDQAKFIQQFSNMSVTQTQTDRHNSNKEIAAALKKNSASQAQSVTISGSKTTHLQQSSAQQEAAAEIMGLRKDQQSIQSKRSLLKSGGGPSAPANLSQSVTDKQSPMVSNKKTPSMMASQNVEIAVPNIRLPTLNPHKNSIASQNQALQKTHHSNKQVVAPQPQSTNSSVTGKAGGQANKSLRQGGQQQHQALSNISNKNVVRQQHHPQSLQGIQQRNSAHENIGYLQQQKFTTEKRIQSYDRNAASSKQNNQRQTQPKYQGGRATVNAVSSPPAKQPKKEVVLSESEIKNYGNRCPKGYQKLRILGKGGVAVVWQGKKDGQTYAMKQFPKNGTGQMKFDPSAYVELQMAQLIRQYSTPEEKESICLMMESVDDKKDLWLIYELCEGRTMNEHLFDVKGEFYKGERIYMVHHSHFYHALRTNLEMLQDFLFRMCMALSLFARLSIVHGDLKPDNIIIDYDPETQSIRSLKIIDLGSSFLLNEEGRTIRNQCEFVQSTPEYLPPEIHSFLSKRFTNQTNSKVTDFAQVSFIFDVWSLGSILLEVLSGFPLWLSLKSRVLSLDGHSRINMGLFGVAGRDNQKIMTKQNQLFGQGLGNLMATLKKGFDFQGNKWAGNADFIDLFNQIMCLHPGKRIHPEEILEHEFMAPKIMQKAAEARRAQAAASSALIGQQPREQENNDDDDDDEYSDDGNIEQKESNTHAYASRTTSQQ